MIAACVATVVGSVIGLIAMLRAEVPTPVFVLAFMGALVAGPIVLRLGIAAGEGNLSGRVRWWFRDRRRR